MIGPGQEKIYRCVQGKSMFYVLPYFPVSSLSTVSVFNQQNLSIWHSVTGSLLWVRHSVKYWKYTRTYNKYTFQPCGSQFSRGDRYIFMLSGKQGGARKFSSVQSLSRVWLFATPWIAASLSITNSRSSLRLMSIESMMPSNHLILCRQRKYQLTN